MTVQRALTVLGSTGSIGVSTLDVAGRHPDRFRVVALTAQRRVELLFEQCCVHRPEFAVVQEPSAARGLEARLAAHGVATRVLSGEHGLDDVATLPQVDTVMGAIVGIAGLRPVLAAARAGKRVLLANKEALVTAGALFMEAVRASSAVLLPIDSEHNAIFQVLPRGYDGDLGRAGVRRILLTASGGPFRTTPLADLAGVTPEAACAHPNWVMGRKISVDSATMMNKGLEVIEARWLFGATADRIEVVVHPQSVVHSLVEYVDGSVIAQLGNPDMRTPIAHALAHPQRIDAGVDFLQLARVGTLTFEAPDVVRFPCLKLAYDALRAGGGAATVLNAANEIAVARFLERVLPFAEIPRVIGEVLEECDAPCADTVDDVYALDREARACAERQVRRAGTRVVPAGNRRAVARS